MWQPDTHFAGAAAGGGENATKRSGAEVQMMQPRKCTSMSSRQERLRVELEDATKRSAADVAELEAKLEQAGRDLAVAGGAAAAATEKAAAEVRDMKDQAVRDANAAAAELKAARETLARELERMQQEADAKVAEAR